MSPTRPSRRSGSRAWPMSWLVAGALAAGCGPHSIPVPAPRTATSDAPSCLIVADSAGTPRPVTAVFADSADAERARRTD